MSLEATLPSAAYKSEKLCPAPYGYLTRSREAPILENMATTRRKRKVGKENTRKRRLRLKRKLRDKS
jgi:hypothetical protein